MEIRRITRITDYKLRCLLLFICSTAILYRTNEIKSDGRKNCVADSIFIRCLLYWLIPRIRFVVFIERFVLYSMITFHRWFVIWLFCCIAVVVVGWLLLFGCWCNAKSAFAFWPIVWYCNYYSNSTWSFSLHDKYKAKRSEFGSLRGFYCSFIFSWPLKELVCQAATFVRHF